MDYIHIRPLVYRDRGDLDEFGVEDEKNINAQIFECLLTLDGLNPKYHGVFSEILRLFNDVYFYLTIIFIVKRPLELYPDIINNAGEINKEFDWHNRSEARVIVILSMLHILLHTFGKKLPLPQQKLYQAICNELNSYSAPQSALEMLAPFQGEREPVVYKMTNRFQFNKSGYTNLKQYYMPRNIKDVIDGDENLESCLWAGSSIVEAVKCLCKNKEQKMQLIDRLLEPEKKHYGFLDSKISAAYRSLYELKAELTGEPLLEKLPFERIFEANARPFHPVPQSIQNTQSKNENEKYDDRNETISSLREKVRHLNDEVNRLTQENAEIKSQNENTIDTTSNEDVEKLKTDLEHYKSISETYQDIIKRYEDELGPIEKLDDWKEQLSIKERIIFFQALTGCSLKGVDKKVRHASQIAKAKLIARFSGNNSSKIRSGINQLYKEIEEVETKKRKDFSKGTKDAAQNVYNFLHLAVEGTTIGSKPNRCQIAMQIIDQTYHLNIDRAVSPPKDDDFLIEREPQDE